jgi:ribose transport system substrate-binding protein
MRKLTLYAACVLALAVLAGAGCGDDDDEGGGGGGGGGGGEPLDVTLIQGVRGDEFYITMACGAQEAAKKANVKLDVQGPEEFDAAQQTPIVNSVVASQPDAILIAPTDVKAMIAPIQQAVDAGIKVILVDTVIEADLAESEIATDNLESGRVAAETLIELMPKPAPVLVVNVKPGISTTDQRQQGFEQGIEQEQGYEYLGAEFSNNDPAKAASIVTSTLQAESDLGGIFATNLFSAEGSATGLQQSGNKAVRIVGFDAGPAQVEQLKRGLVQALIAQKPGEIGKLGVEQAVAAVNGDKVTKKITTGTEVITKENLDSPEGQAAVYKAEC